MKQRFDFYKVVPPTSRIDFSLFNNENFKAMEKNLILLELDDSIREVRRSTNDKFGKVTSKMDATTITDALKGVN